MSQVAGEDCHSLLEILESSSGRFWVYDPGRQTSFLTCGYFFEQCYPGPIELLPPPSLSHMCQVVLVLCTLDIFVPCSETIGSIRPWNVVRAWSQLIGPGSFEQHLLSLPSNYGHTLTPSLWQGWMLKHFDFGWPWMPYRTLPSFYNKGTEVPLEQ
jgi:hypothetical protein